jgi:hypothetical protein
MVGAKKKVWVISGVASLFLLTALILALRLNRVAKTEQMGSEQPVEKRSETGKFKVGEPVEELKGGQSGRAYKVP